MYPFINELFGKEVKGLFLIAGPCVLEGESMIMETAESLVKLSEQYDIPLIFKSSFEKANRTSVNGFTGIGVEKSLNILAKVKETFKVPLITDVHENSPYDEVANVVDVLQTPAFLCRQSEFLKQVAAQDTVINVKKGQFLSPEEMGKVIEKIESFGNDKLMVCERGTSFGYNYLINDFRAFQHMKSFGKPLVFDATHSVQRPGGKGSASGGDSQYAPGLARAAVAVGVDGIFAETHPDPSVAKSDGPNMIKLAEMEKFIRSIVTIDRCVKELDI